METINRAEQERTLAVAKAMAASVTPEEYAKSRESFSDPYLEIITAGEIELVCFGVNHQNSPEHPQMKQIKDLIDTHQPELVMVEGMRVLEDHGRSEEFRQYLRSMSYEEAAKEGEAFMTAWYAEQKGIRTISPEPTYQQLFKEMEILGTDKRAILLEKLLAVGSQWIAHGEVKDIDVYANPLRNQLATILDLPQAGDFFDQCERYASDLGIPLNRSNMFEEDLVFHLQDPIPWAGKIMYLTNYAAQASSLIRDRMILQRVYDELSAGINKIMIVYGASHIHMQA